MTVEEIDGAYEHLLEKARNKKRIPEGYRGVMGWDDPAQESLLPVGVDKMTTRQVERSEADKQRFFREIQRLFNEQDGRTGLPKFRLKRFKVNTTEEKKDGLVKERSMVILSLRDQVMMRVVLDRLTAMLRLPKGWNDMFCIVRDIHADIRSRKGTPVIIRTDITQFHPSIDRIRLLDHLKKALEDQMDPRTEYILEYVVSGYPSAGDLKGLPLGMPTSVILADFYARVMNLGDLSPGIGLYRYADDILIIADHGTDPEGIIAGLDHRLEEFGLKRNETKTKVIEDGDFVFLGVHFKDGTVGIDESKIRKWKHSVWGEITRDLKANDVISRLDTSKALPTKREVAGNVFREYKRGSRSSYWKFIQRVLQLNRHDASQSS